MDENFIEIKSDPFKIDIYSLGMILYMMLTNKPPAEGRSFRDELNKISNEFSEEARELILNCNFEDSWSRYGLEGIKNSKWFINSLIYFTL